MNQSVYMQFYELILREYPQFASLWSRSREEFGPDWEFEFSKNLSTFFGDRFSPLWSRALDGYVGFCVDALRAQAYFDKTGEYPARSYADAVDSNYSSYDFMMGRYLPGQYLAHYVWPHHYRMLQRYLKSLPSFVSSSAEFYEVGIGCALYSQMTLQALGKSVGRGIDISEHALRFASSLISAQQLDSRYSLLQADVCQARISRQVDFVICQEVLEHLENPLQMIAALRDLTCEGGIGYISAAINAAHTDHIYLYRSPRDVEQQLECGGWEILAAHVEQACQGDSRKSQHLKPTIAGYFLRRR